MTSSVGTFLRSNSNDHTLNHATILFKARHLFNQVPVLSHPYVPCAQHTKSSNSLTLYLYICNNALFWLFPSTLPLLSIVKYPIKYHFLLSAFHDYSKPNWLLLMLSFIKDHWILLSINVALLLIVPVLTLQQNWTTKY